LWKQTVKNLIDLGHLPPSSLVGQYWGIDVGYEGIGRVATAGGYAESTEIQVLRMGLPISGIQEYFLAYSYSEPPPRSILVKKRNLNKGFSRNKGSQDSPAVRQEDLICMELKQSAGSR
jgi:hypothetical protein